ncbi:polyprenol phosphomannose-dependent alpha 1,6 mannosyltransferase MptB [Corynebacterium liangguodongii]|uniref:Alpha 1,6 mannopyranosyltransferase n=1 Tax=Corynebacterium liangguodongii TaxID=2079535 RepID=A0A2S0WE37_9CORY|nr:polyprenol phosphomannose-dependent alpha 1,6 mannosyltransferase MptB [Corynebacterium liangguodongii]AWB84045.1 alpha 1,6 mannopyranosyltransferase [Corynebacterium liangguodongii]PWC00056.1 alpha 1,6 mannopyranosyltransferase [Corynebacterium liangguodongii]
MTRRTAGPGARRARRGSGLTQVLPRLGRPGSRSARLHKTHEASRGDASVVRPSTPEANRFALLRWIGLMGTILIGLGGLGGGALPVVDNPYAALPGGALLGRMLQASSSLILIGVGMLVAAWLFMAPFVGAAGVPGRVGTAVTVRTFIAWVIPLIPTAPLFTQDIYSYLAQGSIVAQGLDPYAAGPVETLGAEHPLARSVPFIWAQSSSPYGPVALSISAALSRLTGDSIVAGVYAHRLVSLAGIAAAAWGVVALARRSSVFAPAALWLGILNPLLILHLVGGIHNEAILLGFLLVGLEVGLRGLDSLSSRPGHAWALLLASGALISCAGLVKVTGFIGLGFTGMALARRLATRWPAAGAIAAAAALQAGLLVATTVAVSLASGIGYGWVTGQGGAATIRSWLSITTDIGVIGGHVGMLLGLGDHIEAMLVVTRAAGLAVAAAFMARMLWATFRGTIHPVGGLGVATVVLVILFPVVHPWYPLWAIVPLAAWANRQLFRIGVAAYSAIFSFLVLPRGLALDPGAVVTIYASAAVAFATLCALAWWLYRRFGRASLN